MTPVSATRTEQTFRTPDRPAPTRDTEQRFEDALARKISEDRETDTPSEMPEDASSETAGGPLLQAHLGKGRDEGDQRQASRGLDEISSPEPGAAHAHPVQTHASSGPDGALAQSSPAMLTASFAEMAMRMALPQGAHSAETSVLMTDPRSIATQAVLVQDSAGAMSLDIGARQDGSSEQQRQELKARLEARGHRIADIRIHPVDR